MLKLLIPKLVLVIIIEISIEILIFKLGFNRVIIERNLTLGVIFDITACLKMLARISLNHFFYRLDLYFFIRVDKMSIN